MWPLFRSQFIGEVGESSHALRCGDEGAASALCEVGLCVEMIQMHEMQRPYLRIRPTHLSKATIAAKHTARQGQ